MLGRGNKAVVHNAKYKKINNPGSTSIQKSEYLVGRFRLLHGDRRPSGSVQSDEAFSVEASSGQRRPGQSVGPQRSQVSEKGAESVSGFGVADPLRRHVVLVVEPVHGLGHLKVEKDSIGYNLGAQSEGCCFAMVNFVMSAFAL